MAESMFMIGWFRILPGKGEHQATNYSIAIRQYFQRNTTHFQFKRVVNFKSKKTLVLTSNSTL